jgi:hypothetical protein
VRPAGAAVEEVEEVVGVGPPPQAATHAAMTASAGAARLTA